MSNKNALHEGLKKMLNYLPMIYNQQQLSTVNNGEIVIKYPYNKIPDNALLFVLPLYSSLSTNNKLVIKFAQVSQDGSVISYATTKTYNIMVEDTNGTKRKAGLGDIVANRLCMFRFITNNSSDVILCNNPIYNNLKCSTLCITNSAKFYKIPTIVYTTNQGTELETPLALDSDLKSLAERVTTLENKFKIGTEPAEEYFNNNKVPSGTIYLQVEE